MRRSPSTSRRSATAGRDAEACYELFGELGFRSLTSEFAPTAETVGQRTTRSWRRSRLSARWRRSCAQRGRFALRAITTAAPAVQAELVGIAVSVGSRQARYIPLAHHALDAGPQPDRREAVAALKAVFEDPAIEKVGHDLKRRGDGARSAAA